MVRDLAKKSSEMRIAVLILVQLDGEGSHMKEVIFRFIWVLILFQLDGEGSFIV